MMHHFIIYQYGKVASTALTQTINGVDGCRAYQCHFLGQTAFQEIVKRLCQPDLDPYFFEHSLGQLTENIRAHRLIIAPNPEERCTILTLCREPFSWFKSAMSQEIEGHLPALKHLLKCRGIEASEPLQIIEAGLIALMERIIEVLGIVNSLDELSVERRRQLNRDLAFADTQEFEQFLFLLGRYLMPHFWFSTQFRPEVNADVTQAQSIAQGLWRVPSPTHEVYMMRQEDIETAFPVFVRQMGLSAECELIRANTGEEKVHSEAINAAFCSETAVQLRALTRSQASMAMGY